MASTSSYHRDSTACCKAHREPLCACQTRFWSAHLWASHHDLPQSVFGEKGVMGAAGSSGRECRQCATARCDMPYCHTSSETQKFRRGSRHPLPACFLGDCTPLLGCLEWVAHKTHRRQQEQAAICLQAGKSHLAPSMAVTPWWQLSTAIPRTSVLCLFIPIVLVYLQVLQCFWKQSILKSFVPTLYYSLLILL